jgi:hypothetical protein
MEVWVRCISPVKEKTTMPRLNPGSMKKSEAVLTKKDNPNCFVFP